MIKNIVITSLISLLISAVAVFAYDRLYAKKVVAIDIASFVEDQKKLYLEGEMTKADLESRFEGLRKVLDELPENYIVIHGTAVVRNVEFIEP